MPPEEIRIRAVPLWQPVHGGVGDANNISLRPLTPLLCPSEGLLWGLRSST
jgi:hypothetical protein